MSADMTMTNGMLAICLVLAAAGATLLILILGVLFKAIRHGRYKNSYLQAAAVILALGLLILDVVVLWCLIEYALLGVDFTADGLRTLMDRAGIWAPLASILLMAAHSFVPFPAELIAVANGLVFGPWLGVLITWLGAMAGAILSYETARALGPAARTRLVPQRYRGRLDAFTNNIGIVPLLTARLIPIVSFNLINYAAGLSAVARFTFIWTTGVGILPVTVLSVLFGSEALSLPFYIWLLVGIAAVIFIVAARALQHAIEQRSGQGTTSVRSGSTEPRTGNIS